MAHESNAPKACRGCGMPLTAARDERGRVVFVESVPVVLPHGLVELFSPGDGEFGVVAFGRPLYRLHACNPDDPGVNP